MGVVGIDFGAAFGYGLNLPIPELTPVRLTRQFMHLMHPLNTRELIKNDMIHVLRALGHQRETLLNIMDVFAKEPSMDWHEFAQKTLEKSDRSLRSTEESSAASSMAGSQDTLSLN